jgi:ABC-type lipoprotein export system ATPase subunit
VPVLEARGVTKTVGAGRAQRRLLAGIDLDVDAGQVVAVLGRSGSGKSTLLHLLGALDRPDQGHIILAGDDLTAQPPRSLARTRLRHVGFVFQAFHLIEELSGEENVLVPTRLPGAKRGGERRAKSLIGELGLEDIADRRPHELSGGEQQRFAIARALVNDPELVLADEPTGNLDQENGAAVLELLRGLQDRAVVLVTHEPQAAAIADRVLHLTDGRLTELSDGRPTEASDGRPIETGARRLTEAGNGWRTETGDGRLPEADAPPTEAGDERLTETAEEARRARLGGAAA